MEMVRKQQACESDETGRERSYLLTAPPGYRPSPGQDALPAGPLKKRAGSADAGSFAAYLCAAIADTAACDSPDARRRLRVLRAALDLTNPVV